MAKLTSKKTEAQPKTLRMLSAEEYRAVSGGFGKKCYYSYDPDRTASYTSSSSDDPKY